ncbi:hypothetical protein H3V17_01895 [Bartonella sp. M0283]|uniref:hypothetical protein n=1 Tax=Bartonella sp. M0283 TaxID=2751016 RepID=UPI0018DC17D3|nr:hypothetical protein [Bartonella sp. M0283]MBI0162402.1 hypothetical protein [Bartonella sp. M0283]
MFRLFPAGLERGSGAIALYKAFVIIDYFSFEDNTLKIIDYLLFEDNALKIRVFHDHFVTVKQI